MGWTQFPSFNVACENATYKASPDVAENQDSAIDVTELADGADEDEACTALEGSEITFAEVESSTIPCIDIAV